MRDELREFQQLGGRVKQYPDALWTYDPETGMEWLEYDAGFSHGCHHDDEDDCTAHLEYKPWGPRMHDIRVVEAPEPTGLLARVLRWLRRRDRI